MNRLPITIEHALLGILHQQPLHGYDIYKQLVAPAGLWLIWRIKQSQLYALLGKLEEAGYIQATTQPQGLRPPRKVYHLTDQGRQVFLDWRQRPVQHGRQMRIEFLAKLYFAQRAEREASAALIKAQRTECLQWLAAQRVEAEALGRQDTFAALVNLFRASQIEALLIWLDTCETLIGVPIGENDQRMSLEAAR